MKRWPMDGNTKEIKLVRTIRLATFMVCRPKTLLKQLREKFYNVGLTKWTILSTVPGVLRLVSRRNVKVKEAAHCSCWPNDVGHRFSDEVKSPL